MARYPILEILYHFGYVGIIAFDAQPTQRSAISVTTSTARSWCRTKAIDLALIAILANTSASLDQDSPTPPPIYSDSASRDSTGFMQSLCQPLFVHTMRDGSVLYTARGSARRRTNAPDSNQYRQDLPRTLQRAALKRRFLSHIFISRPQSAHSAGCVVIFMSDHSLEPS